MMTETEVKTRLALGWALRKTVLRVPARIARAGVWEWDADDASLSAMTDDGAFRFHVAAERRGSRRFSIAVMSVEDDSGKVTWEGDIPAGVDCPVVSSPAHRDTREEG